MQSRFESVPIGDATSDRGFRQKFLTWIAFSWGFCAYFPIGVMYLNLLLMLMAMAIWPGAKPALLSLRQRPVMLPLTLFVAWTLVASFAGGWFPDTGTRLFHTFRVALVLCMGMLLTPNRARVAFMGFLVGSIVAATIVALHYVWRLPDWEIWSSLLATRNNFSSANMIALAVSAGVFFSLVLRSPARPDERWLALIASLAVGMTVVLHAVSRNAHVLLALVLMTIIIYRFRSWRAMLAGLVAVLLLAMTAWSFSPTIQNRFAEVASNMHKVEAESRYNSSIGVRWRMYQEAYSEMVQHPLLGAGVGSWLPHWKSVWASLDQQLPLDESTRFAEINNPHNDFLLAGMETGVPGLLILVWLFAQFIVTGWRQRSTMGGVSVMMAVALAATALVNAPLRDAAFGSTLLWLLGASVAAQRELQRA